MDVSSRQDLLNQLYEYISPHKKEKIEEISKNRTRHINVVLEDIKQPKDASGVIRTCECFGIQEVNIIENDNKYKMNRKVVMGSTKWLDLNHYQISEDNSNNTDICLKKLKESGFRIVAMSPDIDAKPIDELNLEAKTAIMFGSGENGLSSTALEYIDEKIRIPMYGFTPSYNLSVSSAITINNLINRLRKSNIDWQIPEDELIELKLKWVKLLLNKSDKIDKKYYDKYKVYPGFKL